LGEYRSCQKCEFLALHELLFTGFHLLGVSMHNKPEAELMPSSNHTLLLKITVLTYTHKMQLHLSPMYFQPEYVDYWSHAKDRQV
jgi:hypothetical protein